MSSLLRSATFIVLVGCFAGCMVEGGDDGSAAGDDQLGEVDQSVIHCPVWVCGENSPLLSVYFWELNSNGDKNAQGLQLLGMESASGYWKVTVVNGSLIASKPGHLNITGNALKNKVIDVKDTSSGEMFYLTIKDFPTSTPYWPAGSGSMPAYYITYTRSTDPDHVEHNVCSNPDPLTGEYDTLFQPKWTVVFFEGDRWLGSKKWAGYDATKMWFDVGCAGTILAKLQVTHRTTVGAAVPGYANSWQERQAMAKMYAADYCGDGTAFTVSGTPLGWTDWHPWSPNYYPVTSLEARWTENGPTCLESPRLEGTSDPLALSIFGPNIDADINAHCGSTRPPKCSDLGQSTNPDKLYGAMFVSSTPP